MKILLQNTQIGLQRCRGWTQYIHTQRVKTDTYILMIWHNTIAYFTDITVCNKISPSILNCFRHIRAPSLSPHSTPERKCAFPNQWKNWIFAIELKFSLKMFCFFFLIEFFFPFAHNLTSGRLNRRNFYKCTTLHIIIDASKFGVNVHGSISNMGVWVSGMCDGWVFNNDWRKSIIKFHFWGKTGSIYCSDNYWQ